MKELPVQQAMVEQFFMMVQIILAISCGTTLTTERVTIDRDTEM